MILKSDMEKHFPNCLNVKDTCKDCKLVYYPNQDKAKGEKHDCFKAVLKSREETAEKLR